MTRSKVKGRRGRGSYKNANLRSDSNNDGSPAVINPDEYRADLLQKSDMQNARFEEYYKKQEILGADEEEWHRFLEACREPLPTTFRVAGSRETAKVLNDAIENTYVPHLREVVFEDEPVAPPVQLSWYPGGLAWQFNVAKKVLRKSSEFKKFHSFLVFETEVGNITRAEAVSMLPPLFLHVEPHHKVLDMCAAPGSKTSQLLEALHSSASPLASSVPPGLLIANDSDYKRTHLLIHQSARLPSPAFMVTNVDASIFPSLSLPHDNAPPVTGEGRKPRLPPLLFDRILCDVPCSGDGTLRKNVGIWKHWNPMDGNGLHGLQVRILQRAMRMLHPEGRIVYSTCSLNPVENEAVIAEALRTISGFELIDVSTDLPTLLRRPGLSTWTPASDRSLTFFESYDAYNETLPTGKLVRSHFPPGADEEFGLERCIRIYPHIQDTGGFFIAVLQRKKPEVAGLKEGKRAAAPDAEAPEAKKARLEGDGDVTMSEQEQDQGQTPTVSETTQAQVTSLAPSSAPAAEASGSKQKQSGDGGFKEMPYTFISPDDPIVEGCIQQLSLTPDFPSSNILVRNPLGDPARSLYLTNDLVRSVIAHNDYKRIRLMTAGTKIFTKQEGGFGRKGEEGSSAEMVSQFRLLSEGLPVVLPYIKEESIVDAEARALRLLVEGYYPLLSSFDEAFKKTVEAKLPGSHVVRFKAGSGEGASLTHDLVLPIWKSHVSVSLMIDKKAKSALSMRVFGEDITVAGREALEKQTKKAQKAEARSAAAEGDGDDAEEAE